VIPFVILKLFALTKARRAYVDLDLAIITVRIGALDSDGIRQIHFAIVASYIDTKFMNWKVYSEMERLGELNGLTVRCCWPILREWGNSHL
jgi:hypothetical protein